MSTLQERIVELMAETTWDTTKVAQIAGVSVSAVSQWLGKGSKEIKTIGRIDAAIYLERESGFSALWLAKGVGPKRAGRSHRIDRDSWPFPDIEIERFMGLSPNQRIEVQAAVRDRIERFEAELRNKLATAPPARRRA